MRRSGLWRCIGLVCVKLHCVSKRLPRRITWARLQKSIADDSGVAGVLLASVIAIVAFTALSVFLNNYIGDRAFERAQRAASGSSAVMPAVMAYY